MPRRTAAERHLDPTPEKRTEHPAGNDLLEVLAAFHHPTRRWLCELLWIEGPASVGRLSARTGLAAGSVSHHLKTLHRNGWIEPAPDLAHDSRESWWRPINRRLTWASEDFAEGTAGRHVAHAAEIENLRHQMRAVQQWVRRWPDAPVAERRLALSTDSYIPATVEQVADLHRRLNELMVEWSAEARADAQEHPDAERVPIRAFARVFPSRPVRP